MNLVVSNSQASNLPFMDESLSVVACAAAPGPAGQAFTNLAESSAINEDLVGSHDLVVIKPTQEKESDAGINAEGVIVGAALATANAVNAWGVGATILQTGVGVMNYAKVLNFVGPTMAATKPVQYLAARLAERAASSAVNYALVGGVTAGTAASVGFAVLSALTVAEVGVGIHNTFIAKTEADKVSLGNPVKLCMKAFSMFTGFGKKAASAA
jgi:hypothetical protein